MPVPMASSLWEAAGRPPISGRLPPARSWAWSEAKKRLRQAMLDLGTDCRIKSPSSLWDTLHASPMPPNATWGLLFGDATG